MSMHVIVRIGAHVRTHEAVCVCVCVFAYMRKCEILEMQDLKCNQRSAVKEMLPKKCNQRHVCHINAIEVSALHLQAALAPPQEHLALPQEQLPLPQELASPLPQEPALRLSDWTLS